MSNSWISRIALSGMAAVAVLVIAAAPTLAHVTVWAPDASRGGSAVLTFRVPNESATGSSTSQLSVQFPAVIEVDTRAVPGWRAEVTRDVNRRVTAVTWNADPGGGIAAGQFGEFAVLADGLPDTETLTLPATQAYADGQVVTWDQSSSGGSEPEYPAPTVKLAEKWSGGAENHGDITTVASKGEASDRTARWLGAIGIVLGALGLIAGIGSGLARRGS